MKRRCSMTKKHISVVIDKKIAKELIPKNTPYCYDEKGTCPFFSYRKATKENPSIYGYDYSEWCGYLKKYLSIQDQCKDCGINDYEI
jgi:hypothetical protein